MHLAVSASPCPASVDEITPEARPSPCPVTVNAPQKAAARRKRAADIDSGADTGSPTKLSKFEATINKFRLQEPGQHPFDSVDATHFRSAHAARWGGYLVEITAKELAQTVVSVTAVVDDAS